MAEEKYIIAEGSYSIYAQEAMLIHLPLYIEADQVHACGKAHQVQVCAISMLQVAYDTAGCIQQLDFSLSIAGPGNPPVVVDETACLTNAATSIVKGGAYDNNLLCIGEKQVFCVESVFDKLMTTMERHGGFILNSSQIDTLTRQAFKLDPKDNHYHVNKDFVGKDASVLAAATDRTPELFGAAERLLNEFLDGKRVALRLLGVRLEELAPPGQRGLFEDVEGAAGAGERRVKKVDELTDKIAARFGDRMIGRAGAMAARGKRTNLGGPGDDLGV